LNVLPHDIWLREARQSLVQCLVVADNTQMDLPDQRRPLDLGLGKFL
jgi:hypothetical protein